MDHNLATLDAFYGMGIIAVTTPKDHQSCHTPLQTIRRHTAVNVDELVKDKRVPLPGFHQRGFSIAYIQAHH